MIVRNGRRVAVVAPAPQGNGNSLNTLLHDWAEQGSITAELIERQDQFGRLVHADHPTASWS